LIEIKTPIASRCRDSDRNRGQRSITTSG